MQDKFTTQQKSILTGLILGDAYLGKAKGCISSSLTIVRATKDFEYLAYHAKIFYKFLTKGGISFGSRFNEEHNKSYEFCKFTLSANEELNDYLYSWYPNGKKIIPLDLTLDNESIATWICDDGHLEKTSKGYYSISLATNGFSKYEVEFLAHSLNERYNEKCKVKRQKDTYVIFMSDYFARKVIVDIDSVFPDGMNRKKLWNDLNFPKPRYSYSEAKITRDLMILNYINNSTFNFSKLDIAKSINYSYTRANGNVEYYTDKIGRDLEKYIDLGLIAKVNNLYKKL